MSDDSPLAPAPRLLPRATAEWIADQVAGGAVALLGDPDPLVLAALARKHASLTLHRPNPVRREGVAPEADLPARLLNGAGCADRDSGGSTAYTNAGADAVVVQGWPRDCDPAVVVECAEGVANDGARLILVLTEFTALRHREAGFDLASLLRALRGRLTPLALSVDNEELRLVGSFGTTPAVDWRTFESDISVHSVGALTRDIRIRQRLESQGLEDRLERVYASTQFRLGRVLCTADSVWNLPMDLWRMYRTARPRGSTRRPARLHRRLAESWPVLDLPTPRPGRPVVAAILDTFSAHCFRYEADLVPVTPEGWRDEIERSNPAFLLVESAWTGNDGAWHGLIVEPRLSDRNPLRDLILHCRARDIPTVFWNKEDPPHFDRFVDAARNFDVIFTTDADCIPRYRAFCGHDRVYPLPFAAQPMLHNPGRRSGWPRGTVAFAGSWVSDQYAERTRSMDYLLEPALRFELDIFDRNLFRRDLGARAPEMRFPTRYRSAVKGSLEYPQMLTAYRCYDVLLNTNSVADSPTMFSRRVFESLACGTPVVSTESAGMARLLAGHVRTTTNADETSRHLSVLLEDDERRAREGHLAFRHVHEHHTYRHRMDEIRHRLGLDPLGRSRTSVSVVAVVRRAVEAGWAIENFARQSYHDKELILVPGGDGRDAEDMGEKKGLSPEARFLPVEPGTSTAQRLNRAVESASGEYVFVMSADCLYGERYVADMMLCANFAGAEVLGKGTYFVRSGSPAVPVLRFDRPEHQYTDFVVGSTLAVRRDALRRMPFREGDDPTWTFLEEAGRAGCRIYSADRFNHFALAPPGHRRVGDEGECRPPDEPMRDLPRDIMI